VSAVDLGLNAELFAAVSFSYLPIISEAVSQICLTCHKSAVGDDMWFSKLLARWWLSPKKQALLARNWSGTR
jgi:hypothetical protein